MSDDLRLFVGIDIGAAWTETLSSVAESLAPAIGRNGRWVRPELYHVTVLFLGNQPPAAVAAISEALAGAASAVQPFELRLREVVRFGRHEHGALVAAVDDPSGTLQDLRARLDEALRRHRIAFDARGLVPHVTLARPRRGAGPLAAPALDLRAAPPLLVSEVNLVRSDLRQTGPRYEAIATARVGRPASP
jgi:2'-5' RNA ligase